VKVSAAAALRASATARFARSEASPSGLLTGPLYRFAPATPSACGLGGGLRSAGLPGRGPSTADKLTLPVGPLRCRSASAAQEVNWSACLEQSLLWRRAQGRAPAPPTEGRHPHFQRRRRRSVPTGRSGPSDRRERVTERHRVFGTQRRAWREGRCEERDGQPSARSLRRAGASKDEKSR